MKKLRLLSTLIVLAFITLNMAIAQPKNYTITQEDWRGEAYDGSEWVSGILITETKWNSNKVQVKLTWHLVGETSGAHYEAGAIDNLIYHDKDNGAINSTYTYHFFGKRDNVPMGYGQMKGHLTITPDGTTTVDFFNQRWIHFY